ncbi:MAG: glycine--tRNA ligase subunit beta [Gammaproteobacteria bacterium]|nr:glycine--tRNA ligase subunit beta [Gammaproteobacteria bacterium]|tara:strand:+ start:2457 stop:4532 length:2076 start_codon:yes stop_codon:yes gene_type:complete
MSNQDLLIEIGTEELPPKALLSLSRAFEDEMAARLEKARLTFKGIQSFATPRRLALKILQLADSQEASEIERFGPAIKAAYDDQGKPTKAAEGFARSCGVEVAALKEKNDGKVTKLFYSATQPGDESSNIIPDLITQALAALPIPKRMRWGSSREEFVRPVHWFILLFGDRVISAKVLGLESSKQTYGHRFLSPEPITINSVADYPGLLREQGMVEASFNKRMETIRELVLQEANALSADVIIDEALLEEVTALVEWPVALTGNFDKAFLQVPKEALISSLTKHQKCFYLLDKHGNLLPHFITISNIISKDPAEVIKGNERVIGPRLADAAFFFDQDKKLSLESRIPELKKVIFQNKLGSVFDKSERVRQLSVYLAKQLNVDEHEVSRAAALSKCDLLSLMVGEFADLQGIMGEYYAAHDGEPEQVARAIREQYLPRFSGDELPQSSSGLILALADRLDTICGLFGIGQPPTGSKDPFALRRSALGVLRILLEKGLRLDLSACIQHSISTFSDLPENPKLQQSVVDFIYDRLRAYYSDQGIQTRCFQAVDAVRSCVPLDFDLRVRAVNHFISLPEAEALAASNKRVANILAKLDQEPGATVKPELLHEAPEKELYDSLLAVQEESRPLIANNQFQESLESMASLQKPLDHFFDSVMVNAEDENIRHNRQALLLQVRTLFLQIADISFLQVS